MSLAFWLAVAMVVERQNGHEVGAGTVSSSGLLIMYGHPLLARPRATLACAAGGPSSVSDLSETSRDRRFAWTSMPPSARSVGPRQRVITLRRLAVYTEQLARRQRRHLLEVAARTPIGQVTVDGGRMVGDRQETDEVSMTSGATDGRLFMRRWNELHARSDGVAEVGPSARTRSTGLYSNAGWLKVADTLHYTRL
jgi:hypothetical protein